jgi:hypothetical protein
LIFQTGDIDPDTRFLLRFNGYDPSQPAGQSVGEIRKEDERVPGNPAEITAKVNPSTQNSTEGMLPLAQSIFRSGANIMFHACHPLRVLLILILDHRVGHFSDSFQYERYIIPSSRKSASFFQEITVGEFPYTAWCIKCDACHGSGST